MPRHCEFSSRYGAVQDIPAATGVRLGFGQLEHNVHPDMDTNPTLTLSNSNDVLVSAWISMPLYEAV